MQHDAHGGSCSKQENTKYESPGCQGHQDPKRKSRNSAASPRDDKSNVDRSDDEVSSLQFDNQPLQQAQITLRCLEDWAPELDDVHRIRQAFLEMLPEVGHFMGGSIPGFSFSLGRDPGLRLSCRASGLSLVLTPKQHVISWDRNDPDQKYPHYEPALRPILSELIKLLDHKYESAAMSYLNIPISLGHGPQRIIRGRYLCEALSAQDLHETVLGWRNGDWDYRVELKRCSESEVLLATSCGGWLHGDTLSTIDKIHDLLQPFFEELTTEEIRNEWIQLDSK